MNKTLYLIFHPLKKYASFSGRASRKEKCLWALIVTVLLMIAMIFDGVLGWYYLNAKLQFGILASLVTILLFFPTFALASRRLHDTNRSGWRELLILMPIIGWSFLVCWSYFQKGDTGSNRFGKNPKEWENKIGTPNK